MLAVVWYYVKKPAGLVVFTLPPCLPVSSEKARARTGSPGTLLFSWSTVPVRTFRQVRVRTGSPRYMSFFEVPGTGPVLLGQVRARTGSPRYIIFLGSPVPARTFRPSAGPYILPVCVVRGHVN